MYYAQDRVDVRAQVHPVRAFWQSRRRGPPAAEEGELVLPPRAPRTRATEKRFRAAQPAKVERAGDPYASVTTLISSRAGGIRR